MARVVRSITLCVDCSFYLAGDESQGVQPTCWHPKVRINENGVTTSVVIPDWCPLPKVYKEPEPLGSPPFRTIEEWDRYHKNERNWSYVARNAVAILSAAFTNLDLMHMPSGLRDMTHDHHDQPRELLERM